MLPRDRRLFILSYEKLPCFFFFFSSLLYTKYAVTLQCRTLLFLALLLRDKNHLGLVARTRQLETPAQPTVCKSVEGRDVYMSVWFCLVYT